MSISTRSGGKIPLVVDLDGTLIANDLLHDSIVTLLARQPLQLLTLLQLLKEGKAAFKHRLAALTTLDAAGLPYRTPVLAMIETARGEGRPIYLASASHDEYCKLVSDYLGIFDGLFTTSETMNMAGENKASALVAAFGDKSFDYIGNSRADVEVWRHSRRAFAIGASKDTVRRMKSVSTDSDVIAIPGNQLKIWLKAIRVHQYVKNTLIFLPLLASHQISGGGISASILAFLAFSAAASSIYLINDLADLNDDRLHPSKKRRPLAAGQIGVFEALLCAGALLLLSTMLCLALPYKFTLVLLAYLALTTMYSFWLKRKILIDVVLLALLYSIRVIAGGYATGIVISDWLIGFSIFVFTSLALIKRYTELLVRLDSGLQDSKNRAYQKDDLPIIATLAAATGGNSVTVLGLYIASPQVVALYSHPRWLWVLCPLLLFLMSRALLVAHRRQMHDDPIVWALRDRVCLMAGAIGLIVVLSAAS